MTQMGIELQHPVTHKNRSDRLIEGLPTLITKKGVKLANRIVTPNITGKFQAILANLGNDKVCLKRGMTGTSDFDGQSDSHFSHTIFESTCRESSSVQDSSAEP